MLIVDDHAPFRARARELLEAEGFVVVGESADGRSALAAAHALKVDVVLLDVQLPDVDGFEVAATLASEVGGPAVVLVSSRDAADFGSVVAECGAQGFIGKGELSGSRLRSVLA